MNKLAECFSIALNLVAGNSSQVVNSVREYLRLPPSALYDLVVSQKHKIESARMHNVLAREDLEDLDLSSKSGMQKVKQRSNFVVTFAGVPAVELDSCDGFLLDLRAINVALEKDSRLKFQIVLKNCTNFTVLGGIVRGARNFMITDGCSGFDVRDLRLSETEGYGVIIFNSQDFVVDSCLFHGGLASGVYCLGEVARGEIKNNVFARGTGYYNWDAGLHINHCSGDVAMDSIPELSHEPKRLIDKIMKPTFIDVHHNAFMNNRAQGIYCEGAVLCRFTDNVLMANNKEGICFDWGSALNYFANNFVTMNGDRANMSPEEIKADFIEQHPVLPDNSSSCKLPGLSIDNGALNVISENHFVKNYGGGIKMVRTGVCNVIIGNNIFDNGVGNNQYSKGYHGITFLGLGSGRKEFSPDDDKLDFMPSACNLVMKNSFGGQSQHHGVFAGPACPENLVFKSNKYLSNESEFCSNNLVLMDDHVSHVVV